MGSNTESVWAISTYCRDHDLSSAKLAEMLSGTPLTDQELKGVMKIIFYRRLKAPPAHCEEELENRTRDMEAIFEALYEDGRAALDRAD